MLKQRIWASISAFSSFIKLHKGKVSLAAIATLIGIFEALGIWNKILGSFLSLFLIVFNFVKPSWEAPIFVWLIIFALLVFLAYRAIKDNLYLGKVAGEFYDDFKKGLSEWDYKGDWRIEKEGNKPLLSVRNSDIGGFTKKGFTWTDYEFSFETKVIKEASGWIIRANGNDFFMIQLRVINNIAELRPHFHKADGGTTIWILDEKKSVNLSEEIALSPEIRLLQWIKVKIIVDGNQVDVFLNDTQALHYLIDSFGTTIEKSFTFTDDSGKELKLKTNEVIPVGSYTAGRIGFRCGDTEHAHFKNVRVKPL